MTKKKQFWLAAIAIGISTAGYFVPTYFASSKGTDLLDLPAGFYDHYAWRTSGAFFLTSFYSWLVFILINPKRLVLKLGFCWLAIGETLTLINHVITKFYFHGGFNEYQIAATLGIFSCFLIFFTLRAILKPKSDEFNPKNTYIVRFLPKNTLGIFNYIFYHTGHKGFYQDGFVYRFKKSTGDIQKTLITPEFSHRQDVSFKEIPKVRNPDLHLGKKYSRLFYNCNHLIKDATRA